MFRIYEQYEFPKGYQDTIQMNGIDWRNVNYVIDSSNGRSCDDITSQLGKFEALGTITDHWIYVVFREDT
jgi:hypothetical protein